MQRENIRRGFNIHQKVVLELDFSGTLWGYTEMTLIPTSKDLRTIHLHSRQCIIQSVSVASYQAEFVHYDSVANLNISNPQDCHTYPELKRKIYSALADGDEGELSIAIPKEVPIRLVGNSSVGPVLSETATPEPQTPGPSMTHNSSATPEFAPITVTIVYSLRNPVDGIQFVIPTDSYPFRVPHVYTTPSSPDAARCWVPCLDSLFDKSTWDFEFVVPSFLEEKDETLDLLDDDLDYVDDRNRTIVVCSGDLVEQVAHPYNSSKTIFLFSQSAPTSVQHVAFAAGPFHVLPLPSDSIADDASTQPIMHAFCLPGHENLLTSTVSFLRGAMSFYTGEFGSYPFGSHKLVFVDEMPTQRFDSATLSLVTVDLLHGHDAIDQIYETRLCLSHALACQWVGIHIQQKTWSDLWLVDGLGMYITGLFIRKLFGNNEYRFRLKKDMERVIEWDRGTMPPICRPTHHEPPDPTVLPFTNLKAPLVLHILDRKLGKSGTSLGLSRVLPKVFLSAISGEMSNNYLSTHWFLRMCRKVSGVDLRSFAEQWIYGSGCPTFAFSASFNRKKMAVEISMHQECPAYVHHDKNEKSKLLYKPVQFFEGQMTIRIHEADGTPYEHVLDIRSPFKRYEVPFNTKYKRVRRNTKRYLARQAAAQAAAEGDAEAAEAMGMIDMGFGLEIWENEKERENWRVADWTEEEEQSMSGATYEWIRMDADFEWISTIAFEQPDFMWVSQLQRDRDVVAQLEAVRALSKRPTSIVASTLTKTVLVTNYFFRVRCEAALALVNCAIRKIDFIGLFHLFKLFMRYCYEPEDPNQELFLHTYVPRANDFSDITEYFVRKSLLKAISRVRFEDGKTPVVVRRFLIDQLRYNDNTANPYSDAFYICTNIAALACSTVCTTAPERGELTQSETQIEQNAEDIDLMKQAIAEVDRYRNMDRLIPSYHNVVTIAALEFYMMLNTAGLIPVDSRIFFPLTREGNATQVRMAAFDAMFMTKWYTPKIIKYILAIIANDPSRVIRRHVAVNACHSLALLVFMGEIKASAKENEALLIEEDGSVAEKAKENKKSEMEVMIKALRKDREVGKNEVLREFLLPIAMAPDADPQVRWAVLKLADLVFKASEEAPPKVTIHLPPTPVMEVPPPSVVKIQPKPQRPAVSVPAASSPVIKSAVTPRLKLLPTASFREPAPKTPTPVVTERRKSTFAVPAPKRPQQPEKKKAVSKPQTAGMSIYDLGACRNAVKKLQTHKRAKIFLQPVDPVRDRAPDYFKIIKNPIDLSTISAKLGAGLYKDRFGFEADFRLMINNAKRYNSPGTFAHGEAIALEMFFEKQWTRISKTLESHKNSHPTAPAPTAAPLSNSSLNQDPTPVKQPRPEPAASNRPVIKLKIGGSQEPATNGSPGPALPKVKVRKSKPSMPPPASPVQSPLPMDVESEEDTKPVIAKTNGNNVASNGKRKKGFETASSGEDDILAAAAPLKKKATPPTAGPSAPAHPPPPKRNGSGVTLKVTVKKKPEPPAAPPRASSTTSSSVDRPQNGKGKEREREKVPSPSVTPATTPSATPKPKKTPSTTPINTKRCKEVMKIIQKLPDAIIFARPVDPIADGCPTYYDEIKNPMDFGTITQRLNQNKYSTMEEFERDVRLVFSNCRQFNPPTTYPCNCADAVEQLFNKEWTKVAEKKLDFGDKRSMLTIVNQLLREDISFVFREPVDPVLLGIPTYFDIIPKKDARDLSTIKQKIDADKYDSMEAVKADVDLMVRNAIVFNGAESDVGQVAAVVKKRFNELLNNVKTKKRKDGEANGQPSAKKLKLK